MILEFIHNMLKLFGKILLIGIVLLICYGIYDGIKANSTKKESNNKKTTTTSEIQSEGISEENIQNILNKEY